MLANHCIKDIPAFWDHLNAQKTEMNPAISDIAAFWDHLSAQKNEMNAAISDIPAFWDHLNIDIYCILMYFILLHYICVQSTLVRLG